MMMSPAIRGYPCKVDGDEKYNHNDQTPKVNIRKEMENINKDLGNKNENVKKTCLVKRDVEGKYF